MAFAFLALLTGVILLYAYKYTFRVALLLKTSARSPKTAPPCRMLRRITSDRTHSFTEVGRWALVFLLLAFFLMTGASPLGRTRRSGAASRRCSTAPGAAILCPAPVPGRGSPRATGVGLSSFCSSGGGARPEDPEYRAFVDRIGHGLTVISLLAQPAFLIGTVALMPPAALSSVVFFLSGLGLLFLFLAAQFLYSYRRDRRPTYVALTAFASESLWWRSSAKTRWHSGARRRPTR